jgi:DNA-directed RNA polymerase subunit F
MNRTGWEHHELEKEISNSTIAQLLELFKRESEKYTNKCVEFANSLGRLTESGKKQIEEEALLLSEGREKVALHIVEILTDVKRIQREIAPKR